MEQQSDTERRRFLRVPFETKTVVKNLESGTVVNSVHSKDISLKGMYCFTKEPFAPDTPCSIELHLTGTSSKLWLHIEGHVVRNDDQGMALSFDSMDMDVFIHLKNILYYNSGDPNRINQEIRQLGNSIKMEKK